MEEKINQKQDPDVKPKNLACHNSKEETDTQKNRRNWPKATNDIIIALSLWFSRSSPEKDTSTFLLKIKKRASLVAQWLRVCLPMQETRVRALVWEGPTCRGATGPVSNSCWACASGACAPQRERPQWWEARAPRWRVAPACHNWRKP